MFIILGIVNTFAGQFTALRRLLENYTKTFENRHIASGNHIAKIARKVRDASGLAAA
jgi:hypothetical protein